MLITADLLRKIAMAAYDAYRERHAEGTPLPDFDQLPEEVKTRWAITAAAAIRARDEVAGGAPRPEAEAVAEQPHT